MKLFRYFMVVLLAVTFSLSAQDKPAAPAVAKDGKKDVKKEVVKKV